ncbi:MAG: hypothetical protein SVV03_00870 [Candidatus Nanohaloarchaea archaeon]|nr:hypothetical protein [Candidatus Nanohaloarchaea archaeon]
MYENVKQKLKEAGEVMVLMDSGEEHELHLHNIKFLDDRKMFKVDAADEIHWLSGEKVERYWIHKEF